MQGAAELLEVVVHPRHFDFQPGQVEVGRDEREIRQAGRGEARTDVGGAGERTVKGGRIFEVGGDGAGGIALGVEVDEEDALAARGETGGQVDRSGRFADAAFWFATARIFISRNF